MEKLQINITAWKYKEMKKHKVFKKRILFIELFADVKRSGF